MREEASHPPLGRLYIVGTPIGNLADLSPRALEVLGGADVICAEDTRVTGHLLRHYGLSKELMSLREHNENRAAEKILALLAAGKTIAQVTDAGMPGICDPGYRLVRQARAGGFPVISVPGPCAFITALSITGVDGSKFYFGGFLPAKKGEREAVLAKITGDPGVVVYYESPHRILASLRAVQEVMPERDLFLVRELTKKFETVLSGHAEELIAQLTADPQQQKGEMVLIFAETEIPEEQGFAPEVLALADAMVDFLPVKKIVTLIADIAPINKKELYAYLLTRKKSGGKK